jgi:hypothetical protein
MVESGTLLRRVVGLLFIAGAAFLIAVPQAGAVQPEHTGPDAGNGRKVGLERRAADAEETMAIEAGDPMSPQPPSNADFTGNGANVHGAYDSTRDGSASENGVGDGAAIGQPCAGCVGKADNKNPPGQFPDGLDANAGYECDRNEGVGKTNPAHTGCLRSTAATTTTTTSTTTTSTTSTTTTTLGAQVLGVSLTAPPAVAGAQVTRPAAAAALGATGAGMTVGLTILGLALLLTGSALLMWRPRLEATSTDLSSPAS